MMKRSYAQSRFGQIHVYQLEAQGRKNSPPLILLHPMPYSGLHYATIAPYLNRERDVIAPDFPGYGGSDKLAEKPSINDFAVAMIDVLADMGISEPCDFFGFHTGCLVATEISLIKPEIVRKLVLVDVPYFEKQKREELYDQVISFVPISTDFKCLETAWQFSITKQIGNVPLERSFELFVEQLRAGNGRTFGYHAAFTYPCEEKFPQIEHPTLVIATKSGLFEETHMAAKKVPDCTLEELLDIEYIAMDIGAKPISKLTLDYL